MFLQNSTTARHTVGKYFLCYCPPKLVWPDLSYIESRVQTRSAAQQVLPAERQITNKIGQCLMTIPLTLTPPSTTSSGLEWIGRAQIGALRRLRAEQVLDIICNRM